MSSTKQTARTVAVALSLMLLLAGCSGISTSTDYDPAAKGLRKVDSGGDLAVAYQVTTAERSTYNTVSSGGAADTGTVGAVPAWA
jgi:hypothetical protein